MALTTRPGLAVSTFSVSGAVNGEGRSDHQIEVKPVVPLFTWCRQLSLRAVITNLDMPSAGLSCSTLALVGTLTDLLANFSDEAGLRGKQFEHVCKWFLSNDPVYRQELRRVWLWDEWPGRWGADAGIDLVAEEHNGNLWAIQAKAYDPAYSITKADVNTFLSESARPQFAFRLLMATTDRIGKTAKRTLQSQEKAAGCLLLGDLRAAQAPWPRTPADLRPPKPRPKRPRPHQRQAITAVVRGFEKAHRGQMIMACGTGKTLTALFIAERLAAKRTLVLVPSLSLLADTLREWAANSAEGFDFLPVCSDDTVSETDALVSTTSDLGFPVTTDPAEIATFLRRRSGPKVLFASYQSSPKIAEAFRLGRVPGFDLVIADEAHRCAGRVSSDFATVLESDAIPTRRRLFMTATPRYFTGRVLKRSMEADFEVASMADQSRFGPVFHRLGFSEAIKRGLLTDYQVVVVGVDDATYLDWAQRGRFVTIDGVKVTDARTLAGQIGLAKAMRRYDLRRTISFHSRVSRAREFAGSMIQLVGWMPTRQRPKGRLWSHYASGEMSAGARSILLDHLRHLDDHERGLLANARCLGEGVDVPALDGVAFIDPRRSEVDIVQAVGRAIRLAENKKVGTIVIPVFIEAGDDPDAALDGSAFKPVWDVVRALRSHDDLLGEELDQLRRELGRQKLRVRIPSKIHLDLPARVGSSFADAFDVHLVEQSTASWEFWLGLLERFAKRENHVKAPFLHVEDGYRLGKWMAKQRAANALGQLSTDRVDRLDQIPGWSWNTLIDKWEEGFTHLRAFVDREGSARVPPHTIVDGYRLGQWVNVQRIAYVKGKLGTDRIGRLDAVEGWSWNAWADRWEEGFRSLCYFAQREGNACVPRDHIEDGYPLGTWVGKQRSLNAQGQLADDRVTRLESLPGWSWDTNADNWEKSFERLGDLSRQQKVAGITVLSVSNKTLRRWVSKQRTAYSNGQISADRVARLESLPNWTWKPFANKWEEGFVHLQRFAEREGHARVPLGCVDGGFRLGQWVSVQRSAYARKVIAPERIPRLEALPGWSWSTLTHKWEEGFSRLRRFSDREGHVRVPQRYIEDGFRLGGWVSEQRTQYAKGNLSKDRVFRLAALPGWTWASKEERWEAGVRYLHSFVKREGHPRVPRSWVEDGYPLGAWVKQKRALYSRGQLPAERISQLEAVPDWAWNTRRAT